MREIYGFAVSKNITKSAEYNECFQILAFQSKDELIVKVSKVVKTIENDLESNKASKDLLDEIVDKLETFVENIESATTAIIEETPKYSVELDLVASPKMDRKKLKEVLLFIFLTFEIPY